MSKVIRLNDKMLEKLEKVRKILIQEYEEDLRSMRLITQMNENEIINLAFETIIVTKRYNEAVEQLKNNSKKRKEKK